MLYNIAQDAYIITTMIWIFPSISTGWLAKNVKNSYFSGIRDLPFTVKSIVKASP